jgi:chaperonin GroES
VKVMQPLQDMIFVTIDDKKNRKVGAIIVPDTVLDRLNRGTVVAVGPGGQDQKGNWFYPRDFITEGDYIMYGPYDKVTLEDGREVAMVKYFPNVVGKLAEEPILPRAVARVVNDDSPF